MPIESSLTRNDLYRLMISQLEHDGFEKLAVRLRLTGVIDDSPPYPLSDRLMELVKLGLEKEQDIVGTLRPSLDDDDYVVNDWNEQDIKKEILNTMQWIGKFTESFHTLQF